MARRGLKLGVLLIRAGDGASTLLASVDYHLDSTDGWFFAKHDNEVYSAASREELENVLKKFFRARHQVDFDPYIEVEMPTSFVKETTVVGVEFRLVWISRKKVSSNGKSEHWLQKRGYFIDGDLERPAQQSSYPTARDSMDDLLPYTPDRYTRLGQIEQAIEDLHTRLKAVLTDGKALDALAGGGLLLEAAPSTTKKAKR